MKQGIKKAAVLMCLTALVVSMTSCASGGSIGETTEQLKDKAEKKYNELAEKLVDADTESLDIQDGYFSDDGGYAVVVKNNSEDKILSKFSINFEAYDADGNTIEPDGFPPNDKVGPLFPGESAVSVAWGSDSWTEQPSSMGYAINTATWGGSAKHVAITEITEDYYGGFTVTISNLGENDVDLQEDHDKGNFEIYAVFRDSDGTVTGVSYAYLEDFLRYDDEGVAHGEFPVLPAGSELTTSAEVYEMHPGTAEIVIVWRMLM